MSETSPAGDLPANPLINPPALPYGAPPFDLIRTEHFMPAIEWALEKAREELDAIRNDPALPTFENTIEAMENAGKDLARVKAIFEVIADNAADDDIRALEDDIGQIMSAYSDEISFDPVLFARIEAVYNASEALRLDAEQTRLLESLYEGFVDAGVNLPADVKNRLQEINEELTELQTKYEQNVTLASAAYKHLISDESELDGVPERAKNIYRDQAKKAGHPEKWLLLMSPYPDEVMSHGTNRALREELYYAYRTLTARDPFDNEPVVRQIVKLRHEAAQLRGHDNHATYVLKDRMAETPEKVFDFLWKNQAVYGPAYHKEMQALKELAERRDGLTDLKPWDLGYYSRILLEETAGFDMEEMRPYLSLGNVLDGLRHHGEKFADIEMRETSGIYPVYHPDVKVYEIHSRETGETMALLYADYYTRAGAKEDGAWMGSIRERAGDQIPIITNSCNFPPPTPEQPTQLDLGDVEGAVFHEFGHGLHGALAKGRYASINGTNVVWDFVETQSQLQELWVGKILGSFARHFKTGAALPEEMMNAVQRLRRFQAGMTGLHQTFLAMLDMKWHTTDPDAITSMAALEDEVIAAMGLPPRLGDPRSTNLSHIFGGGYDAGLYSYKWAEVMAADLFEDFEDNPYDPAALARVRPLYTEGNKEEATTLYMAVKGRPPRPEAMFRRESLLPSVDETAAQHKPPAPSPAP